MQRNKADTRRARRVDTNNAYSVVPHYLGGWHGILRCQFKFETKQFSLLFLRIESPLVIFGPFRCLGLVLPLDWLNQQ